MTFTMSLFSLFVAACPVVIVHTAIKAITSVRENLCDCHNVIVLLACCIVSSEIVIDHIATKVITRVPVNLCDCHNVIVLFVCCIMSSCYCSHSHQGHHKCSCESL